MENDSSPKPATRRQFLQGAGAVGGALVLGRAAAAQTAPTENLPAENVLKLDEHPDLQKVGGFEIVLVGAEKVIVAHTEAGFVACSAICPHKGCEIGYRASDKQFVCPCHGARFDEAGKVVRGPAKTDLKPFDAAAALLIKPAKAPKAD